MFEITKTVQRPAEDRSYIWFRPCEVLKEINFRLKKIKIPARKCNSYTRMLQMNPTSNEDDKKIAFLE